MKLTLFFIFICIISSIQAQIIPIFPDELNYIKKAFTNAEFMEIKPILDPITVGAPNTEIYNIYDKDFIYLGKIRNVFTDVGCNSMCKPLDFSLVIDPNNYFYKLLTYEPLTKLGHREFTEADNLKLRQILLSPPPSFAHLDVPMDLIDGATGATKLNLKDDVVSTAALTCFRIYQYTKQTLDYFGD